MISRPGLQNPITGSYKTPFKMAVSNRFLPKPSNLAHHAWERIERLVYDTINSVNDGDPCEGWSSLQVRLSSPVTILGFHELGAGGLSTGLELSGHVQTCWALEWDQKASEAFRYL